MALLDLVAVKQVVVSWQMRMKRTRRGVGNDHVNDDE